MRVMRFEAASLWASCVQQDIYFQLLVDAALQVDDLPLARSLLKERLAIHFTAAAGWQRYIDMTHRIDQANDPKVPRGCRRAGLLQQPPAC